MVANYRSISILCKLPLVFERMLFDFIYPKVKFLICKQQRGFMKLRSTVTQMIDYLDVIYKYQDNSSPAPFWNVTSGVPQGSFLGPLFSVTYQ